MILQQFYLNCLAHASYLVGDEPSGTRPWSIRSATSSSTSRLPTSTACDRARHPHPPPRGLHRRAPRTARSRRRRHLSRRGREGRVRVHAAPRRRSHRARTRASGGARDARAHRRVDLDRGLRPRSQRDGAVRGADRRHAVRRRRRPSRSARRARLVGGRSRRAALRVAAHEADGAAGQQPGLSGARRRLAVRQGDQQGDGLDDRRAAAIELRAAADERRRRSSTSSPPISPTRRPTSPTTPC